MLESTFKHTYRKAGVLDCGNWYFTNKPKTVIWNKTTDEEIHFKNIEDAYENAVIDGVPLKNIVAKLDMEKEIEFD